MKSNFLLLLLMIYTTEIYSQTIEVDSIAQVEGQVVASDSLINLAKSFIGVPYKYGGATPSAGFDCSGFVKYVFANFGMELPRTTSELANVGIEIPLDSCKKGDLIVFSGRNKASRPIGHVGIVTSDLCEPVSFIHSATSKNRGIVISAFDRYDYYKSRLVKVIRVVDELSY
jgi:lipoprotein Spr